MKKYLFFFSFLLAPVFGFCQGGFVYTTAGGGMSMSEGVPATSAFINTPGGVALDASGNIYFVDSLRKIRKVAAMTGIITTIAGNGSYGFSGDGGPATVATIGARRGICFSPTNNIIFPDDAFRIRSVNLSTGTINTIAGNSLGFSGDSGPATLAALNNPMGVCTDATGNVYICDRYRIRKINATTSIITTIAGTGSAIFSGDGGSATSAGIDPAYICTDAAGNIYFSSLGHHRIRKIDATTGIITTIGGTGGSGYLGDFGPATAAEIGYPSGIAADPLGNIYIAMQFSRVIRKIKASSGIITTVAGGGTGTAEGDPVLCASLSSGFFFYHIASDPIGNVYFSDGVNKIKEAIIGAVAVTPSINVFINGTCYNTQFTITSNTWAAGMYIKSLYGDGNKDSMFISSTSCISTFGTTVFYHAFPYPGTFTVKHLLISGTTILDSVQYSYTSINCNWLSLRFFHDLNADCQFNSSESYNYTPILVQIDSNGIPIDTVSVTTGLSFRTYGLAGTVYSFRSLSSTLPFSCPVSGIMHDTIPASASPYPTKYVGLQCIGPNYDYVTYATIACGRHQAFANILINNLGCNTASVKCNTSFTKYTNIYAASIISPAGGGSSVPPIISGTNAELSLNPFIAIDATRYLIIRLNVSPDLTIGDTVHSSYVVNPIAGDLNPTNNTVLRVDTVRAGIDPNFIEVTPSCYDNDTTLHFTVHFENTGNDTAYNVHVLDTISTELDWNSIELLAVSHLMNVYYYQAGGYNIVKFDFPNIKLLDSSWHGLNGGMFVYKIKTKTGLPVGSSIFSRVGIYFDYNDVVMTNTVENKKGCPVVQVTDLSRVRKILVYPNPATDELTLQSEQGMFSSLIITNTIGQQVWVQDITGTQTRTSIKLLPSGIYYLTLKGAQGHEVRKFVKW